MNAKQFLYKIVMTGHLYGTPEHAEACEVLGMRTRTDHILKVMCDIVTVKPFSSLRIGDLFIVKGHTNILEKTGPDSYRIMNMFTETRIDTSTLTHPVFKMRHP